MQVLKEPNDDERLTIFSDGNFEYTTIISEFFEKDKVDYGQLIKIKKGGKVVEKKKKVIFGNPEPKDIETTSVECVNSILRERISRLVRKTKCHGKEKRMISNAVELFRFYWNFMKPLHGKVTPAMEEGLIGKPLTWGAFLHMKLRYLN